MIYIFLNGFLHLDQYLNVWAGSLGPWLYVMLFLIIFCETGLVIIPFLPGDSLLFAVGALAATEGSPLHVGTIAILLCLAAVAGDTLNYAIGFRIGPKVFSSERSFLLNKKHLFKAELFYEKHGGKTIIMARFMPIIRTFAPFVAGIGRMKYSRFLLFNVTGGIAWIFSFLLAGYIFGNQEIVKRNFHYVILAIIIISMMPALIEWIRSRKGNPTA